MRWKAYITGDTRIRTFFAFFPIKIGCDVRWLEKVTVEEEYFEAYGGDGDIGYGWTIKGYR